MQVSLVRWEEGKRYVKSHSVHRLVAHAWLLGEGQEVNHKDGDKTSNHADNLEWVSSTQNKLHATAHGLYPVGPAHYKWKGGGKDHKRRESERQTTRTNYTEE